MALGQALTLKSGSAAVRGPGRKIRRGIFQPRLGLQQGEHLLRVFLPICGQVNVAVRGEFLRQQQIRAVCLFRKNLGSESDIRQLTADLRAVMGKGALIGIDQEGGSVIRATSLPQAPAAMALGAIGDEALAEQVGAAVARGLRSLGINWNFAPVLDVNNNPANPVIGERSFGEDPALVTRMARAWMRGSLREGDYVGTRPGQ